MRPSVVTAGSRMVLAGTSLALLGAALVLGGCSGSGGPDGPRPTALPATADPATASCRAGREAPVGQHAVIDYVSFVQHDGVFYRTDAPYNQSINSGDIGPVIGHVRCHLDGLDISPRAQPRDGDASFAAKGAAIHAVRGYLPACRIAVRQLGTMTEFKATVDAKTSRIAPCAR